MCIPHFFWFSGWCCEVIKAAIYKQLKPQGKKQIYIALKIYKSKTVAVLKKSNVLLYRNNDFCMSSGQKKGWGFDWFQGNMHPIIAWKI